MQYIDPTINYEDTAHAWASHLDKPFPGSATPYEVTLCLDLMRAIWRDITLETMDSIEIDPDSFANRVSDYRYNIAMRNAIEY